MTNKAFHGIISLIPGYASLRIPKESIFTGVNNFASYSVLEEEFSGYFGFTRILCYGIAFHEKTAKVKLMK